jgi:hypothetical protein
MNEYYIKRLLLNNNEYCIKRSLYNNNKYYIKSLLNNNNEINLNYTSTNKIESTIFYNLPEFKTLLNIFPKEIAKIIFNYLIEKKYTAILSEVYEIPIICTTRKISFNNDRCYIIYDIYYDHGFEIYDEMDKFFTDDVYDEIFEEIVKTINDKKFYQIYNGIFNIYKNITIHIPKKQNDLSSDQENKINKFFYSNLLTSSLLTIPIILYFLLKK